MVDIRSISDTLRLGDDGIWRCSSSEDISYPSEGNENFFAIEDNSFWFKHRNQCITSVVKNFSPDNHETIFDIGGGNGFVSLGLANAGFDVALVEPGSIGASNAKSRGVKSVICATTHTAKFKQNSLPAVGLFDVIEHIEEDVAFLQSIRSLMKQGGRLYATVPSYSCLWSEEDIIAGHFRRYSVSEITHVLERAGFEVEFSSFIFRFLPLPIYILRTLPYQFKLIQTEKKAEKTSRDHAVKGGLGAKLLRWLLQPEIINLQSKKAMRFGGSCIIVAKKP